MLHNGHIIVPHKSIIDIKTDLKKIIIYKTNIKIELKSSWVMMI